MAKKAPGPDINFLKGKYFEYFQKRKVYRKEEPFSFFYIFLFIIKYLNLFLTLQGKEKEYDHEK